MRLGLRGEVRDQGRDNIAGGYTLGRQCRGEPRDAVGVFAVGLAVRAIDHGQFVGINQRGPFQRGKRRERHVIGRVTLQPGFILHPAHDLSPP